MKWKRYKVHFYNLAVEASFSVDACGVVDFFIKLSNIFRSLYQDG